MSCSHYVGNIKGTTEYVEKPRKKRDCRLISCDITKRPTKKCSYLYSEDFNLDGTDWNKDINSYQKLADVLRWTRKAVKMVKRKRRQDRESLLKDLETITDKVDEDSTPKKIKKTTNSPLSTLLLSIRDDFIFCNG